MMLTVLHVPYTYYPDPVGGTEIYVEQLADELRARDFQNIIVAPGKQDAQYEHRGVMVHRLGVKDALRDLNELYGEGDANAARAFGKILDAHKPAVVHLHAFTRIVSARLAQEARERNIPVVFTYHTPTVSCLRGTLMLWGREPCDGVLQVDRCTRCHLHSLGVPKSAAAILARAPHLVRAASEYKRGGIWTALRMRELVAGQHAAFHAFTGQADAIVALCEWTRQILLRNAVPAEKIVVVPHGVGMESLPNVSEKRDAARHQPLRVVTLGRLEPTKGIDLLVRALAQLSDIPIALDIYGITQSEHQTPYARRLRREIARDARIRLLPPVSHKEVIPLLRQYDILAVPSQWFETGPLVVLEAFAADIPVIGSNLGGIAEQVTDGVNGLLPSFSDARAWAEALRHLAQDRAALERLRVNVRPPRKMTDVAAEMAELYVRLTRTESARV